MHWCVLVLPAGAVKIPQQYQATPGQTLYKMCWCLGKQFMQLAEVLPFMLTILF